MRQARRARSFVYVSCRARLLRPRLRVDSATARGGIRSCRARVRHAAVACLAVVFLSCAGHAVAQNALPSRSPTQEDDAGRKDRPAGAARRRPQQGAQFAPRRRRARARARRRRGLLSARGRRRAARPSCRRSRSRNRASASRCCSPWTWCMAIAPSFPVPLAHGRHLGAGEPRNAPRASRPTKPPRPACTGPSRR